MSTQIFLGNSGGCKPEYTKIVSHSFAFKTSAESPTKSLFLGGNYIGGYQTTSAQALWSTTNHNIDLPYTAGNITQAIKTGGSGLGIPIPINLIPDDKVKITGTVNYPSAVTDIENGYNLVLTIGVYYFSCEGSATLLGTPAYTFIPVATYPIDPTGVVCFSEETTLGSNFDFHDTRLLVGYQITTTCNPSAACEVEPSIGYATVSYTLDIERPCPAGPVTNFIIKNCCDTIIQELVNIPGLVVGNFYVDDEYNSWEVISTSSDVTNFTRNFIQTFESCDECKTYVIANTTYEDGCPENLVIKSCCFPDGAEYVTGSLPALQINDVFADDNGLCWYVDAETGAPITEESITVGSPIYENCDDCLDPLVGNHPCPNFYRIESCCARMQGVVAIPGALIPDSAAFVDTNGICWVVKATDPELPTMYGITPDPTKPIYTAGPLPEDNCTACISANLCPENYYLKIRMCCDPDRVYQTEVPADFMIFNEGTIFQDYLGVCWEVMSIATTPYPTTIPTYEIYNWTGTSRPNIRTFPDCNICTRIKGAKRGLCRGLYEIQICGEIGTQIVVLTVEIPGSPLPTPSAAILNGNYYDPITGTDTRICFEVIGYATPVPNTEYPSIFLDNFDSYTDCTDCLIKSDTTRTVELAPCCGGPNIIVNLTGSWLGGIGTVQGVTISNLSGEFVTNECFTLIGLSSLPYTYTGNVTTSQILEGCNICACT